jgi:hypothetical protein
VTANAAEQNDFVASPGTDNNRRMPEAIRRHEALASLVPGFFVGGHEP